MCRHQLEEVQKAQLEHSQAQAAEHTQLQEELRQKQADVDRLRESSETQRQLAEGQEEQLSQLRSRVRGVAIEIISCLSFFRRSAIAELQQQIGMRDSDLHASLSKKEQEASQLRQELLEKQQQLAELGGKSTEQASELEAQLTRAR